MAHNPKLNVYVIELSKKDKHSNNSFFDFFNVLSGNTLDEGDQNGTFEFFMNSFVDFIGGEEKFSKDKNAKKVFGVDKKEDGKLNLDINIEKFILSGILEGGKYGISRKSADVKDKTKRKDIPNTDAILDKFYFMLHTPLNSKFGYLIIQSYTEETILGPFLNKLQGYFYLKPDVYFNVKLEQYIPADVIERFQRESLIKDVKYVTRLVVPNTSGNNSVAMDLTDFELEIRIKPKGKIKPTNENIFSLKNIFGKFKFNQTNLGNFNDGKVFIQDDGKRKANFSLDQNIDKIKPTIYLSETDIIINKNGIPDQESIHNYCLSLLKEINEKFKVAIITD